jgi:hypothetical protein
MSSKHWLSTYGTRIPAEIDPHAHPSVLHMLEDASGRVGVFLNRELNPRFGPPPGAPG